MLLSQISLSNSSDLTCLEAFYDAILRECLFSDDTVREYSSLIRKDRCVEDWYADTGTAFHMTDSLSCMKDVKPCHKKVKGIGGVTCEIALWNAGVGVCDC